MNARPTIEAEAEAEAVGPLLVAAVVGDLAGELLPAQLFSWSDAGTPRVDGLEYEAEKGPDTWLLPRNALAKKRVDCANLVRLYAQAWGTHVGVSPRDEDKLHCVLVEDGEVWDPSRAHGMKGSVPDRFTTFEIPRPPSRPAIEAARLAGQLGYEVAPAVLERLGFAARSPARLAAVARRLTANGQGREVSERVLELLERPGRAAVLVRARETRSPTAVALVFVLVAVPALQETLRAPARRASAGASDELDATVAEGMAELEDLVPGCPGGCEVPW
jgi:hypothetical protein